MNIWGLALSFNELKTIRQLQNNTVVAKCLLTLARDFEEQDSAKWVWTKLCKLSLSPSSWPRATSTSTYFSHNIYIVMSCPLLLYESARLYSNDVLLTNQGNVELWKVDQELENIATRFDFRLRVHLTSVSF